MRAGLSSLVDREIRVLLITGQGISISARGIWHLFYSLDSTVFLGASFAIVTFLFPVPPDIDIPWWMKLTGFSIYLALLPAIYFLQVLAIALISVFIPGFFIFEPVLLLIVAILIETFDHAISPLFFGEQWALWVVSASFLQQATVTFILLLANDVLFCYFVLPRKTPPKVWGADLVNELPPRASAVEVLGTGEGNRFRPEQEAGLFARAPAQATVIEPESAPSLFVELGGQKVPIVSILAIEAEEHYIRVWTYDREIFTRHAFGGLVSQMGETEGFSPRRGIWFSFKNIEEVQKADNGKFVIVPFKGPLTVVPKAKARDIRRFLTSTEPLSRVPGRNHARGETQN